MNSQLDNQHDGKQPKPISAYGMKNINSIPFVVALALSAGCTTISTTLSPTPEQRIAAEQRQTANEQRHVAEREADEQRHAEEERRHAGEDLRRKFARFSTAELKLMDTRYRELKEASGRDLNVRLNARALNSDVKNVERILEIERELLRRWKAGDNEAYLPEFGPTAPATKK